MLSKIINKMNKKYLTIGISIIIIAFIFFSIQKCRKNQIENKLYNNIIDSKVIDKNIVIIQDSINKKDSLIYLINLKIKNNDNEIKNTKINIKKINSYTDTLTIYELQKLLQSKL